MDNAGDEPGLPAFETLLLARRGRRLTITFNRPEALNAVNGTMHHEIIAALAFAGTDPGSDVVVLTGAGRAFSAGGDIDRMEHFIAHPEAFADEARNARQLVHTLLDIEKPLIARVNGHAVGLGATIALFCDIILAARSARIGDPHVAVGLVAGDGGAAIWPQLVGFARAKEYLMTGELLGADEAAAIGLINHAVDDEALDARVDALCERLLAGATQAIRWTKVTVNLELKRIVQAVLEPGLAYEHLTVHGREHRERVAAMRRRLAAKSRP